MTRLFRSMSSKLSVDQGCNLPSPRIESFVKEEGDDIEDEEYNEGFEFEPYSSISTPLTSSMLRREREEERECGWSRQIHHHQLPILEIVVAALRKSLVTCSVEREDVSSMDISWPTDVRHISHVTFDRFNGFLGLPVELEPEVPTRVPSASVRVFGVSPQSMRCSIDHRGNSIPTILLSMQKHLYAEGGLQAEGIFRINGENSQEEFVRSRLNKGVIPRGVDVHCLAGLIKAWFRELPTGVLDSLRPQQLMHCYTEAHITQLVKLLPPTEASLLDWAINLMADVVRNEHQNKMNARNVATVFAPNMTQMADPLTALIHAVQVTNFLMRLIMKAVREREESSSPEARLLSACPGTWADFSHPNSSVSTVNTCLHRMQDNFILQKLTSSNLPMTPTLGRSEFNSEQKHPSFQKKYDGDGKPYAVIPGSSGSKHRTSGGGLRQVKFPGRSSEAAKTPW
ncbi:hypothetical protein Nepgr_023607 [Nepenthes gracilis]|uniref:Rho-GAP domain-containing protein n=1 Tax=Nepenthes gracilis TaxID=150966 RepID=A0AAD3XZ96_NEPGR|nr:hypothetical protein Nepgr_023607 [Nepenthes gracilis]